MRRMSLAVIAGLGAVLVAGCATVDDGQVAEHALAIMKTSFKARGQAGLDRLEQDQVQAVCSAVAAGAPLSREEGTRLEKAQLAKIEWPKSGSLIGDWKAGEKVAQTGVGMQFSDNPKTPAGGNCYACHRLSKDEVSFGTIGPSLYNYGKLRGVSDDMQRYTYGKIYNPQAYTACSNMPRFGQHGILTDRQIRDVVGLLLDPKSPVNQ